MCNRFKKIIGWNGKRGAALRACLARTGWPWARQIGCGLWRGWQKKCKAMNWTPPDGAPQRNSVGVWPTRLKPYPLAQANCVDFVSRLGTASVGWADEGSPTQMPAEECWASCLSPTYPSSACAPAQVIPQETLSTSCEQMRWPVTRVGIAKKVRAPVRLQLQ